MTFVNPKSPSPYPSPGVPGEGTRRGSPQTRVKPTNAGSRTARIILLTSALLSAEFLLLRFVIHAVGGM